MVMCWICLTEGLQYNNKLILTYGNEEAEKREVNQ